MGEPEIRVDGMWGVCNGGGLGVMHTVHVYGTEGVGNRSRYTYRLGMVSHGWVGTMYKMEYVDIFV